LAAKNTTKTLQPCHDVVKKVVVAAAEAAVIAVRSRGRGRVCVQGVSCTYSGVKWSKLTNDKQDQVWALRESSEQEQ
jgi:hypothetical protein